MARFYIAFARQRTAQKYETNVDDRALVVNGWSYSPNALRRIRLIASGRDGFGSGCLAIQASSAAPVDVAQDRPFATLRR